MVFIHGGGFQMGSGSQFIFHPSDSCFTRKGVVLVTINYRLGEMMVVVVLAAVVIGVIAAEVFIIAIPIPFTYQQMTTPFTVTTTTTTTTNSSYYYTTNSFSSPFLTPPYRCMGLYEGGRG